MNHSSRIPLYQKILLRLLSIAVLFITVPVQALLPGDLDWTFNGTGKVTTPVSGSEEGKSVAI